MQLQYGWLAFHLACSTGNQNCCQALLDARDEEEQHQMVTAKTTNGWTPLFHAVNGMKGGHLEIVQWLIDTWAVPVDERDHENKTPLHVASRLGFVPIAKYLIDHNAMVNSVTKDGYTPLHWAALYDKKEIAALLIEKGATVNAQNREKNTPIHLARKKGHDDMYEMIKAAGADLSIRNADGLTPLEMTSSESQSSIVTIEYVLHVFVPIVPIEIKSRGASAIRHYRAALQDGKTKPHRIKLMLLGDARVGKTSLYRYLTGQEFIENLASTEGIDTRLISTPDVYPEIDTVWKVVENPQSEFNDKIALETVKRVRNEESQSHAPIEEMPPHTEAVGRQLKPETISTEKTTANRENEAFSPPNIATLSTSVSHLLPSETRIGLDSHLKEFHKQTNRELSYSRPHRSQQFHSFHSSSDTSGLKQHITQKQRRKKTKKPMPMDHDLSELPMTHIQKHWKGAEKSKGIKFSVWDFAGQPLYEPMHHTFLTRRALYLIVFNLAKLTEKGITESDLQRIHLWVASVHAHTPLDPAPVRIIFVGTHNGRSQEEQVKLAIQQLSNRFQKSKTLSCHIEYINEDDLLARVENSCHNFEDKNICVLRNAILHSALKQSYMKEDIPLAWLQYEDEILSYHQLSLSKNEVPNSRCLLTVQEMQVLADRCHVDTKEGPFKTMITFFHDVGLIMYPAAMEGLNADMMKSLENVVVPNPQWLVDLMEILVKVPKQSQQDPAYRSDWLTLENEGILSHRLMHHIMHEKHGFNQKDVEMLGYLFEALGFICRLQMQPQVATSYPNADMITTELSKLVINEPNESPIHQKCTSEADVSYLVPCQLPEDNLNLHDLHDLQTTWNEFFFDFTEFLPPWLFQYLIVQLVAHMQQQGDLIHSLKSGDLPILSKEHCLVARNASVRFMIQVLAKRVVVQHPLTDSSAQKELMQWLFDIVAKICKQKFKNLTFVCGCLCPHVKCLKKAVRKEGHIDAEHELRVFDYEEYKKLRSEGKSAVKCLHEFRRNASQQNQDGVRNPLITSINTVLSIAQNNGHVEKMFHYANETSSYLDVVPCLFSDPSEIAPALQLSAHPNDVADFQGPIAAAFEQASSEQAQRLPALIDEVMKHHEPSSPPESSILKSLANVEELLPGQPDDQVTTRDLNRLAKRLAVDKCLDIEYLAAELNIKLEDKIQAADNRKQFYTLLAQWKDREGDRATIELLREALKQASE